MTKKQAGDDTQPAGVEAAAVQARIELQRAKAGEAGTPHLVQPAVAPVAIHEANSRHAREPAAALRHLIAPPAPLHSLVCFTQAPLQAARCTLAPSARARSMAGGTQDRGCKR